MKYILLLFFISILSNSYSATFTVMSGGSTGLNIQYYIGIANPGDTIYISNSLLGITLETDELVIDKPLSIIGSNTRQYIERSTESGTPAFRLLRFINCGEVYLKNLEFLNGLSPVDENTPAPGGAIFISDTNCRVYIENCIIKSNQASSGQSVYGPTSSYPVGGNAGAIYNDGYLIINSTMIYDNVAGNGSYVFYPIPHSPSGQCIAFSGGNGGAIVNNWNLKITNSYLYLNSAGAGGYHTFFNGYGCCERGGSGGAIYNTPKGKLELYNCLLYNNSRGWAPYCYIQGTGSAIYNEGNAKLTNTTVAWQRALSNQMYSDSAIYATNAVQSPSIFTSKYAYLKINNSILYTNDIANSYSIAAQDSNKVIVNNSLVGSFNWKVLSGSNNLPKTNPEFIGIYNFRLAFNSPCINQGNSNLPILSTTDLDGQPRIVENLIDMGAYEFQGLTENKEVHYNNLEIIPNPSNGRFRIIFENRLSIPNAHITIIDFTGKIVSNYFVSQTDSNIEINLEGIVKSGLYYINVNVGNSRITRKLIII